MPTLPAGSCLFNNCSAKFKPIPEQDIVNTSILLNYCYAVCALSNRLKEK